MIPQEYFDKVKIYYNDTDKCWDWWKKSNEHFGMFSPLAMLKLGRQKEVMEYIDKTMGNKK